MGYVIRMPQLGMSMDEGTVVEWLIDEGEGVEEDEVVAVVESEKTSHEVECREEGVLGAVLVPEGVAVEPGTPIGVVTDGDEDVSAYEDQVGGPIESVSIDPGDRGDETSENDGSGARAGPTAGANDGSSERSGSRAGASSGGVRATPGAKRLAEEANVDLAGVEGTGPQGVVTGDDVETHVESLDEGDGAVRTVAESRPLTGVQQVVSDRLSESAADAVHVTLNRSFNVGAIEDVLAAAESIDDGSVVSITDLIIAGTADALAAHPEFNALFEEGTHELIEEVNVGVAVDVANGLVTPVVPSVETKTVEEVAERRTELAERVRSNDFSQDDLSGGTFTVSNLGPYGVDDFDPIIDPPQVAILGIGRIRDDGTMTLSLSFDHRVVNGADAARFLGTVVDRLTDPEGLAGYFEANVYAEDTSDGPELNAREVRVETPGGFAGRYRAPNGAVRFDEPVDLGGTGSAPSPVDHLLGAFGSCLALAVRDRARRDGVEVGAIEATVSGSPKDGALEAVEVELALDTDDDEAAVEKAVTKAERACYVHRALSDDIDVALTWVRA